MNLSVNTGDFIFLLDCFFKKLYTIQEKKNFLWENYYIKTKEKYNEKNVRKK